MIRFVTKDGKKAVGLTDAEAKAVIGKHSDVNFGQPVPLSELYKRPSAVARVINGVRSFIADIAYAVHVARTGRD